MIWLIIISFLTTAVYTAAVCFKQNGVPYSISATFYKLKCPYWFMTTMWLTAGLLMPAILEVSRPNTEWIAFLACAGMFMVGSAPNFKEKSEGRIHIAGAVISVIGSQVWVGLNLWPILFVWLLYIGYTALCISKQKAGVFLYKFYRSKPMFWIEICSLLAVYMTTTLKILYS